MKGSPKVEIKDKILLTIEEAAAYSGISATIIRGRLREAIMILYSKMVQRP